MYQSPWWAGHSQHFNSYLSIFKFFQTYLFLNLKFAARDVALIQGGFFPKDIDKGLRKD